MQSSYKPHQSHFCIKPSLSLVLISGVIVSTLGIGSSTPAWADRVIVQGGSLTVQAGEYDRPRAVYSRDNDAIDRDRYGDRRWRDRNRTEIEDSVLIRPVVIDSSIEDSVLIDPVIVNTSDYDDVRVYSTGGTRPNCRVLSNFRAACN